MQLAEEDISITQFIQNDKTTYYPTNLSCSIIKSMTPLRNPNWIK